MLLLQGVGVAGGVPGFVAGTGASVAARKLGEVLTKRAVDRTASTVLAGRGAQAKTLAAMPAARRKLLVNALLGAEAEQKLSPYGR